MREDFKKVLCECYKEGRGGAMTSKHIRSKIKQSQNDEDGQFYSKMISNRKIVGYSNKGFGENLAPLKRYIGRQVNRPWNKVYSEIKAVNKGDGAVANHIFQHLFGFIEINTEKIGDVVYSKGEYRISELRIGDLYVDPDDGIIKIYKKNLIKGRKKRNIEYAKMREEKLDDNGLGFMTKKINGITLGRVGGIWYECRMADIPGMRTYRHYDGTVTSFWPFVSCKIRGYVSRQYNNTEYCVYKRQLNSKELSKFGLTNRTVVVAA
jgi:hypothetical protein